MLNGRYLKRVILVSVPLLLLILVYLVISQGEGVMYELYWEGRGARSSDTINYDQLRSSLKARFGDRLIEVGFSYLSWLSDTLDKKWLVAFRGNSLTQDDIELIRNLFSSSVTIEIWTGVRNCTILDIKPPVIQINR